MHRLYARQLAQATNADGKVDLDRLGELVIAAYADAERDRRRTDRSMTLMVEELDELNRDLERLVDERTRALRAREAELRQQNMRLDAALSNMSHALLLFDADFRLVICNQRYYEIYGLSAENVRPGMTLREILEHKRAIGVFHDDINEYVAATERQIAEGRAETRIIETGSRAVAVLVQPTADGGWVSTHEDITDRLQAERKIAHMAHHDPLTDLPNRTLLRERLRHAFADVSRGERLAVMVLNIDRFKTINDTLGHHAGDTLLGAVADRLRACVRDGDAVGRPGGDEFTIIQRHVRGPDEVASLAARIRDAIREPYRILGHEVLVDATIGIALAPDDGIDADTLIKNAGVALDGARANARGGFRFFEVDMDARMKLRRELELALRVALDRQEFHVDYQPQMRIKTGEITGFEALLRWRHPRRGEVPPSEFVPLAEELGLVVPIGAWALRTACAEAARWPRNISVAVNLSPVQISQDDIVGTVSDALAKAGLAPERLEIEITETVLMQNTRTTLAVLHRLRDMGVRIALDDFGTGYSSLSYLRSFPFDKIKIDRTFIHGIEDDHESAVIVAAITGLARQLDMTTTAEGVENERQLSRVRDLGCTEMQGHFLSVALPANGVERLLGATDDERALTG